MWENGGTGQRGQRGGKSGSNPRGTGHFRGLWIGKRGVGCGGVLGGEARIPCGESFFEGRIGERRKHPIPHTPRVVSALCPLLSRYRPRSHTPPPVLRGFIPPFPSLSPKMLKCSSEISPRFYLEIKLPKGQKMPQKRSKESPILGKEK